MDNYGDSHSDSHGDLSTRRIKENAISTVISNITVRFEWDGIRLERLGFSGPTWCIIIFRKIEMANDTVISMSVEVEAEADNQEQFENDIIQLKLSM